MKTTKTKAQLTAIAIICLVVTMAVSTIMAVNFGTRTNGKWLAIDIADI